LGRIGGAQRRPATRDGRSHASTLRYTPRMAPHAHTLLRASGRLMQPAAAF